MITTKEGQVREIVRCGHDPIYFLNHYVKISHPTRGTIKFRTFPFQDDCVKQFNEHRFNIVLKSRQLGLSTVTAGYALWLALFHKEKTILVIATKLPTAMNFIRKVKGMLMNLPKWLIMPRMVAENRQQLEFSNGSWIKAIPTSEDAGRSEALSLLVVDEAAFVRNFDELWMGLYPTLSAGGRAILISTPNGVGNLYHELYTGAEAGLNDFNPIKLEWTVHPEHDEKWFENECRGLNNDKRKISQELLCDFISSGDNFLRAEDIEWVKNSVATPIDRIGPDKNFWIWRYPLSAHRYIISADVARGDAKDFSAAHVIDIDTNEVVAEYLGKMRPDKFGEMLAEIGMKYNKALICPENNTFGATTCHKLQDLNYPRLYVGDSRAVYITNFVPTHIDETLPGISMQGKNRMEILSKFEEVLRNKQIKVYSTRLCNQLNTFVWSGSKFQALKNKNDDLIMSLAIGVWIFDVSGMHGKEANTLNQSMLAAFGAANRKFSDVPGNGSSVTSIWSTSMIDNQGQKVPRQLANERSKNEEFGGHFVNHDWLLK
jgi:hypothetical protein